MTFGEKLLKLRKEGGLSQEGLAEKLSVSRQAVSRWENEGILPDCVNLLEISRLFGVSTDYLLLGETNASDHSILLTKISDLPPIQYRHLEDIINSFILALEEREAQSGK